MTALAEGRRAEGVALLWRAYELLPHPNVLYNIGRAQAEDGHYPEAIDAFERYLRSQPPDADVVEAFILSMEELLAADAAREGSTSEPDPSASASTSAEPAPTQLDAVAAAEQAAAHLDALAEATGAASFAESAERLRAYAQAMRSGSAPTGGSVPQVGGPTEDDAPPRPAALEERSDAVYEEEVVSASRLAESPLDAPNSTTIITAQDIRLSGHLELGELMRRAAGVEVMAHTPLHTEVAIRGLNQRESNKVLVLLNGRSVRLGFLGTPFLVMTPVAVEDIERIEIIRGPASAVYGADAVSGVVNIITTEPGRGDSWVRVGGGTDGTAAGSVGATGGGESLSYRMSAAYRRANSYSLEVDRDRVDLGTVANDPGLGLEQVMFRGEGRARLGQGWLLDFGSGATRTTGDIQGQGRLRQQRIRGTTLQQTHVALSSPVGVFFRGYWNHFRTRVDASETPPGAIDTGARVRLEEAEVELGVARQLELGVPMNVSAGVGYRLKDAAWTWQDQPRTEHHTYGYIQDILQVHPKLRLALSFRVDHHPLLDRVQSSPRASLVWRVAEGQSIRLTGGSAFRSPALLESYLEFENRTRVRGVTAYGLGNRDLEPERMISFEVGYANQATNYFALEANLYFNLFDHLSLLRDFRTPTLADIGRGTHEGVDIGYLDEVEAFPIGTLRFDNDDTRFFQYGGELGLRVFPATGLDVYVNYSYHRTEAADATSLVPARRQEQRTPPHKVNAGVQYRSRVGLDVALDLHWVDDQTWTEQVTDPDTGVRFVNYDLDGYTLLNGRIGWRFLEDRLEVAITGSNLLLKRHRQHPFSQVIDTRALASATYRF